MPRGFTENERRRIRERLIETGRELIAIRGLRHTGVEELARTAGISKGAFYLFFESKEALIAAVFEQIEIEYQAELLSQVERTDLAPRERLREMLRSALLHWRRNPSLGRLRQEDVAYLQRALPPDALNENRRRDEAFLARLFDLLAAAGATIGCGADTAVALIRALFFVSLHEEEIGSEAYPQALDILIDGVVMRIVTDG